MAGAQRTPRFCPQCGAELPPGAPRFCIECGYALSSGQAAASAPMRSAPVASPMTVRLPNARVEQSVVGGTVKLPSSGAVPPGMWVLDEPPTAQAILAIYAPLRAVVGGWSGLSGQGWRRTERRASRGGRVTFTFVAERVWFPAPGCGGGLQLHITIAATAEADEGRERLGFRYREGNNPPMQVIDAVWRTGAGEIVTSQPVPAIQIMAPPRIPRVSDLNEQISRLRPAESDRWLAGSVTQDWYQLLYGDAQQRTPAGRGLLLVTAEVQEPRAWLQRILNLGGERYRARLERPFTIDLRAWPEQVTHIRREGAGLGLDLETDTVVEWWLDRYGYDSVIFTGAQERYQRDQVIVAFRRSQIARV